MSENVVKASQLIDWTHRDYVFTPVDGGAFGRLMAWGKSPLVGDVLLLRNKPLPSAYRVTEYLPGHVAADYDGFTVAVEFIRGRDIEDDR